MKKIPKKEIEKKQEQIKKIENLINKKIENVTHADFLAWKNLLISAPYSVFDAWNDHLEIERMKDKNKRYKDYIGRTEREE